MPSLLGFLDEDLWFPGLSTRVILRLLETSSVLSPVETSMKKVRLALEFECSHLSSIDIFAQPWVLFTVDELTIPEGFDK